MYTTPSTQHHLHYITKLTIINTTPSTQHHQHNIIKHWQVQHLGHCHLTPSASFLLISLFVFLRCGLFFVFVSLTYSTVGCPKTLLTCGVIRSYNENFGFHALVISASLQKCWSILHPYMGFWNLASSRGLDSLRPVWMTPRRRRGNRGNRGTWDGNSPAIEKARLRDSKAQLTV